MEPCPPGVLELNRVQVLPSLAPFSRREASERWRGGGEALEGTRRRSALAVLCQSLVMLTLDESTPVYSCGGVPGFSGDSSLLEGNSPI